MIKYVIWLCFDDAKTETKTFLNALLLSCIEKETILFKESALCNNEKSFLLP